ncbi:MAG: DegT/DnrJ/EryC1/StrS family aminotransferase [Nitrososphaerota archaeon]|nr:DegT/DnrJ/EryC1/StrS family aminotransferase [Nitrososphaerota archaeon]
MSNPAGQAKSSVKMAKPFNNDTIEKNVIAILRSGMLVQGRHVKQFEIELSQYIGCKHVVAVNSGTSALHLALMAVSEGRKVSGHKEVITTPFSFAATANAAIHAGCVPVFTDVDLETFNIDTEQAEERVSENTVAIEPVDVYGLPAELVRIGKIARENGFGVVEDAAEAIGATLGGKKIGSVSDVSCFSTYATKNLHTGEGGFITTNDDALADQLRMARNQGQVVRYSQKILGYNFRMLEISAAIGLEQLKVLDSLNAKRRENAIVLREELGKIDSLGFQKVKDPKEHAWYLFSLTVDERKAGMSRDKLVSKIKENGVDADVAWPTPIHLQPYFKEKYGYKEGDFPNAEKICKSVFHVPIQPFLTQEEIRRVASAVKLALKN